MDDLVTLDPWSRVITLSEARWHGHVLVRHPELAAHRQLVAAVLTEPRVVTRDRYHGDRDGFYRWGLLPTPLAHLALKVVVGFRASGPESKDVGFVITVFPTSVVLPSEVQRWP